MISNIVLLDESFENSNDNFNENENFIENESSDDISDINIKKNNIKTRIVIGGYHASALPNESYIEGIIDQVVVGEGEDAIIKIINGCKDTIVYGRRMELLDKFFQEYPAPVDIALMMFGAFVVIAFGAILIWILYIMQNEE